jgi:hypothetical protein
MAHYAKLDENNIVTDVIVIANKDCLDENGIECEEPGRCMCQALTRHANWKKTSYNTRMGVHYDPETNEPSDDQNKAYRLNFAQPGFKYDEVLDGFVITEELMKKRVPRMVINPQTGYWALPKPEIPYPEDLQLDDYPLDTYQEPWFWDESNYEWIKMKHKDPPALHIFLNGELI